MHMTTEIDLVIGLKIYAICEATANPQTVTPIVGLHGAISTGRDLTLAAGKSHTAAVDAVSDDNVENKVASEKVHAAIAVAVDEYAGCAADFRHALIPTRKKDLDAMDPEELANRRNFIESLFETSRSTLQSLGRSNVAGRLRRCLDKLVESPYVPDKAAIQDFKAAVENLEAQIANAKAEDLDNAELQAALTANRASAHKTYQSYRSMIQGILGLSGSPNTVDDFILAEVKKKNPAKAPDVQQALAQDPDSNLTAGAVGVGGGV